MSHIKVQHEPALNEIMAATAVGTMLGHYMMCTKDNMGITCIDVTCHVTICVTCIDPTTGFWLLNPASIVALHFGEALKKTREKLGGKCQ